MIHRAYHAALLALYQLSIAAGIVLLPLALTLQRFGISIPAHRVVKSLESAYEGRTESGY